MSSALEIAIARDPRHWVNAVAEIDDGPPRPTGPILIERGAYWTVAFDTDVLVHRGAAFGEFDRPMPRTWVVYRESRTQLVYRDNELRVRPPTEKPFVIGQDARMIAAWLVALGWWVDDPPDALFATRYIEPPPWPLPRPPLAPTPVYLDDLDDLE